MRRPSARDAFSPDALATRDALADAAHDGDWRAVLDLVETDPGLANAARVGSRSGFTPLQQTAWHGADNSVVHDLIAAGAWRTLRTADGSRAVDIAEARGHRHLCDQLRPAADPVDTRDVADTQSFLDALITVRARRFGVTTPLRLPPVEPLTEIPDDRVLWCAIAGMYGGFALRWHDGGVSAQSWSRIVEGSGQSHRITPDGVRLVESGTV